MREPAFWWRKAGAMAALLSPLGAIYGALAARRMARPGHACGIPVICIGNLTVGGAGKTPAALAVVELLRSELRQPFFLTRGYGGRLHGPVRVDPAVHISLDVGDEALLLARAGPTIVAADRAAGAKAAREAGAEIVVMDDGLQNPALTKDVSILVIDGRRGIGNGLVIPAGPLRAPVEPQLDHVNAVLVVDEAAQGWPVLAAAAARKLPLFHGKLEPDPRALAALRGKPVLAFAGIGDPERFFATLHSAGIEVRARHAFPDHHPFSAAEARVLVGRAQRGGLTLVTTEKDMARIVGHGELADLAKMARALPVRLVVTEAVAFRNLVLKAAG